ncbi:cobalamin biosynthesis protein P47K [Acetobacterium paludosum]|uniref:Cobalamin biosynthesis protein P47K n=1 Tax=Acetobacterium paludosum TaxID=52693 RepID=A0A923HRD4_9FIRM|nr:GTP-binding protein [Acetobacterium paludosum]MBC3887354.1 cobalamin biosynthesis protein P47K [Acetobacterium paludosum]
MKILILGGFLGSGKTTVLLQLAHYLVTQSPDQNKTQVAIIENEIGQIGIDDQVLRGNGYEVRDIFSGCVCCSLNSDLITGIQEIRSTADPEWLIIEATGVAFPDKIAESIFCNLGLASRIVTIVDAKRWKRIRVPLANLIEGQLGVADVVLINKTDLVNEAELIELQKELRNLNDDAALYRISGVSSIDEEILKVIENG